MNNVIEPSRAADAPSDVPRVYARVSKTIDREPQCLAVIVALGNDERKPSRCDETEQMIGRNELISSFLAFKHETQSIPFYAVCTSIGYAVVLLNRASMVATAALSGERRTHRGRPVPPQPFAVRRPTVRRGDGIVARDRFPGGFSPAIVRDNDRARYRMRGRSDLCDHCGSSSRIPSATRMRSAWAQVLTYNI